LKGSLLVWNSTKAEVEDIKFGDEQEHCSLSKWRGRKRARSQKLNREQKVQECDATKDK